MRVLSSVALVAAIVATGTVARGDDAGEARRLFEEGRALLEDQRFSEACAKFARSFELDRKPGTQLNLGECAEREGRLRRAWLLFDDAARDYDRLRAAAEARLAQDPGSLDARRDRQVAAAGAKLARARSAALRSRLAKVIVRIAEPRTEGLAIRIADRAIPPAAEIVELLDARDVEVTVIAPGRVPFTTRVRAQAGREVVVEVPPLRPAAGVTAPPRPPPIEVAGPRSKGRVRLALGLGAGGVALLATSGVFGLLARAQYEDAEAGCAREAGVLVCSPAQADEIAAAGTKADVATYTGIAGGLMIAGAVVLYVTAPREAIRVTPIAGPGAAGVAVSGRF